MSCYSLSVPTYISYARPPICQYSGPQEAATRAVAFVEWIFSGPSHDAAINQYKFAMLRDNQYVRDHNTAVLTKLTCNQTCSFSDDDDDSIVSGVVVVMLDILILLIALGIYCF